MLTAGARDLLSFFVTHHFVFFPGVSWGLCRVVSDRVVVIDLRACRCP